MGRKAKKNIDRKDEYEKILTPYYIGLLKDWDVLCDSDSEKYIFSTHTRNSFDQRMEVEYFIRATKTFQKNIAKIAELKDLESDNEITIGKRININFELSQINCEVLQTENELKIYYYDVNTIYNTHPLPPHLKTRHLTFEHEGKYINPMYGIFDSKKDIANLSEKTLFKMLANSKLLPSVKNIASFFYFILSEEIYFSYYSSKNKQAVSARDERPDIDELKTNEDYYSYIDCLKNSTGLKDLLNFTFQKQDLYILILRMHGVGIDRIIEDENIYLGLIYGDKIKKINISSKKNISTRYFKICSFLGQYGLELIDNTQNKKYKTPTFG